ncbi:conjugal transfer protein TraV, partial [Vibrio alginolyticus]|nr:conjugal transfer protein TraV [Vibrio alginolyticus]
MTTSMQNNPKHQSKPWSKAGLLLLAVGSTLLSGCSSLGLGSSEYGCPGMPDGV